MEEYVLICEDSIEGILTGIYEAYAYKKEQGIDSHDRIHVQAGEPQIYRLFTTYERVSTEPEKAAKVTATLQRELGQEAYFFLCMAMSSYEEDKADAVYHTVVSGLMHHDCNVFARLAEVAVHKAFSYARGANNELLHLKGFLRFQELEDGILYAKISPKNHILDFLAPHFADRFPGENFVIFDERRNIFALHAKYKMWYSYSLTEEQFNEENLVFSEEEQEYQRLFRHFVDKIAITERENLALQQNNLPLRFRPYMCEFVNNVLNN